MRWLLLIVSLCVAARLACCQDTRWSNMAASVHHQAVKGEYDPGRVIRIGDGHPGAGYQTIHTIHNLGDRVLHDPAVSYRSNRAIDDSRYILVSCLLRRRCSMYDAVTLVKLDSSQSHSWVTSPLLKLIILDNTI